MLAVTACKRCVDHGSQEFQTQLSHAPFGAAFAAVMALPAAASVAPAGGGASCRASRVSLRSAGVSETW
jgi:hypothetical protein